MKKRFFAAVFFSITALFVTYIGMYFIMRKNHTIRCYSNAQHPHPEKRSPGYYVRFKYDSVDGSNKDFIDVAFYPIMRFEETFREITKPYRPVNNPRQ
jgi:hypothetical protein